MILSDNDRLHVWQVIIIGIGLINYFNRPISRDEVNEKISNHLKKVVDKNDSLSSVLLTIYSKKAGYFEQFAVGTKDLSSDQPVQKNSQFHSASIGKTMCAAVFGILVDEGKISYDDKISLWLDDNILKGLFAVDGKDYSDQVTIRQLLSHTSGVGDYFEDPVISGRTMLDIITDNPDILFTPEELIAFTRENQTPVGKPGQQFHYSDTGYNLLGLILENIEKKPYALILEERIFDPLGMNDSYLMYIMMNRRIFLEFILMELIIATRTHFFLVSLFALSFSILRMSMFQLRIDFYCYYWAEAWGS